MPRFFCSPAEAELSDWQVFSLQFAPLSYKNRVQTGPDPEKMLNPFVGKIKKKITVSYKNNFVGPFLADQERIRSSRAPMASQALFRVMSGGWVGFMDWGERASMGCSLWSVFSKALRPIASFSSGALSRGRKGGRVGMRGQGWFCGGGTGCGKTRNGWQE
jgi:hypothetical protein